MLLLLEFCPELDDLLTHTAKNSNDSSIVMRSKIENEPFVT